MSCFHCPDAARVAPVILVSIAWWCGCAGAPPASAPSSAPAEAPAATASAAEAPAAGPSAQREADARTEPYAKILSLKPVPDAPSDRRAHIEFINPGSKACTVASYNLKWASSSKRMPLERFSLEAGQSRQRYFVVHPNDGDLSTLTQESATVEIEATCGP